MPKSMLNLQINGKQVTTLADNALLLAMINPDTIPDDAVIEWGDLRALMPGYTLSAAQDFFSPADATTYYFGSSPRTTGQTTPGQRKIFIPKAGKITRVDISIVNAAGTVGSNQTSSMYLRLNDLTDTLLSNAIVNTQASEAASYFNITGLSIPVAAGDFIEIKWVTPTWATNPTNVVIDVQIYVQG